MCRHVASKGEAAAKAREPVAIVITVELSNRYVSRYVAVPVAVALVGIAALATSLTPSYRPTDLVIGASATYVGLWVLLVAEVLATVAGAWWRVLRPYLPPRWQPGKPQRLAHQGTGLWSLLFWAALLIVVVNGLVLLHLSGGFPLI